MRILVALDETDASDDALDYALDIAVELDASLLFMHVVEPAVHVTEEESTRGVDGLDGDEEVQFVRGAIENARAAGDQLLHEAARRAKSLEITVDTRLVEGEPLEELAAMAGETSVDGIIVGHRDERNGDHGRADTVGSVAKGLIERSSVPVTVVP
jgi:nucleotide-binding universal stress UspA family protein